MQSSLMTMTIRSKISLDGGQAPETAAPTASQLASQVDLARTAPNDVPAGSGNNQQERDKKSGVNGDDSDDKESGGDSNDSNGGSSGESFPQPRLRLEIRDLDHAGSSRFLDAVQPSRLLKEAVARVQEHLYVSPGEPGTRCPPTRSVTVVLRDVGGVAYTTGLDLDPVHHKEIHFSLGYIASIQPEARVADEITGVLTHELVHCYQWDGKGTCPGGLVEGIADWVRLRCHLGPPHWRRRTEGGWDSGYERTAYFLEYLEGRFGSGTVRRINERLRKQHYDKEFWAGLLGQPVENLWEDYVEEVEKSDMHKDAM